MNLIDEEKKDGCVEAKNPKTYYGRHEEKGGVVVVVVVVGFVVVGKAEVDVVD